jgi:hypothetical protein
MITKFEEYNLILEKTYLSVLGFPTQLIQYLHYRYHIEPEAERNPELINPSLVKDNLIKVKERLESGYDVAYVNHKTKHYVYIFKGNYNVTIVTYRDGEISVETNSIHRMGSNVQPTKKAGGGEYYYMSSKSIDDDIRYNQDNRKENLLWELINMFDTNFANVFKNYWLRKFEEIKKILAEKSAILPLDDKKRYKYYKLLQKDLDIISYFIKHPTMKKHPHMWVNEIDEAWIGRKASSSWYNQKPDTEEEKKRKAKEEYFKEHIIQDVFKDMGWNFNYWDLKRYITKVGYQYIMKKAVELLFKEQSSDITFVDTKNARKKLEMDSTFIRDIIDNIDNPTGKYRFSSDVVYDPDLLKDNPALVNSAEFNIFE